MTFAGLVLKSYCGPTLALLGCMKAQINFKPHNMFTFFSVFLRSKRIDRMPFTGNNEKKGDRTRCCRKQNSSAFRIFKEQRSLYLSKKMANCRCHKTNEKMACEVYSYVDEERVPCSPDGIDEIVLQNLRTDQKNILKKAKKPSEPILCDEAFHLLEEQGISVTSPEIKQFPALIHGSQYKAAIKIIPLSDPKVDRANYTGEEIHEVLFSSDKGEKKIGAFKNCFGANSALSSKVDGYIQIANAERIVVVTSVLSRLFEDETTEKVQFWGASLFNGFTQKPIKKKK